MRTLSLLLFFILASFVISGQCNQESNVWKESWKSCTKSKSPISSGSTSHWLAFNLGQAYNIDSFHIWNYNQDQGEIGSKNLSIYSSLDSISWTMLGSYNVAQASGSSLYDGQGFVPYKETPTKFLLINIDSTYSDSSCVGLSELFVGINNDNCNFPIPIVEKYYDPCEKEYSLIVTNSASYDHLSWNEISAGNIINGLTSGKYSITIGNDNCLLSYPISIDDITPQMYSWDIGTSIPKGEYLEDNEIETSGIIDEGNDIIFVVDDGAGLASQFNILNGGELSIYTEDCSIENQDIYLGQVKIKSDFVKTRTNDHFGLGKHYGVTSSSSSDSSSALGLLSGTTGFDYRYAYRFLSQSSFGGNDQMAQEVSQMGFERWIDWQAEIPPHSYFNDLYFVSRFNQPNILYHTNFLRSWWHNTLTGDQHLRDRVCFALSQIFVISSRSFLHNYGDGFVDFYDILNDHAFGNYRDILYEVTIHPMMGFYLSHMNNPATDSLNNIFPDENYAREILQLFSIGLHELNNDGSEKLDSLGQLIPTYSNEDIIEYAKIFTGLHRDDSSFGTPAQLVNNRVTRSFMTRDMIMSDNNHDKGSKTLLNNHFVPAGLAGLEDINIAIDNIFNHPNVGPFVSIRLIQRLVKSSPSPEYVERITSVFNDDGQGVRGNLKEVVKAILLDNEARDCEWIENPHHGKLKEPLLRFTQAYRAFNLKNTTNTFYALGNSHETALQQAPLGAQSVFNFYTYDYTPPGELSNFNIVAPEFQIFNSSTSIGYVNNVDSMAFQSSILDVQAGEVSFDFSDELLLVDSPEDLVEHLNIKLTYGQLKSQTKSIIVNAIKQLETTSATEKVNLAIYLICTSPEFAILK